MIIILPIDHHADMMKIGAIFSKKFTMDNVQLKYRTFITWGINQKHPFKHFKERIKAKLYNKGNIWEIETRQNIGILQ
eukprot:GAHX01000841.1.p1 GENE.GAHX01000841.1~~GAHX01000841.1.p1  ORF type:complete len:78 (+),score=9.76 GAHX01000841.1:331-564(+)